MEEENHSEKQEAAQAEKHAARVQQVTLQNELSIQRSRLSNERTLLAYIRSALYFSIAGLTINSLVELKLGWLFELIFLGVAAACFIAGILRYRHLAKKLKRSEFEQRHWALLLEDD